MKRRRQRIYWRQRGAAGRAYADFRDYADVGGGLQAPIAPGEKLATTDPAAVLAGRRLNELDALRSRRRAGALHHLPKEITLEAFAHEHLVKKAEAGNVGLRRTGTSSVARLRTSAAKRNCRASRWTTLRAGRATYYSRVLPAVEVVP